MVSSPTPKSTFIQLGKVSQWHLSVPKTGFCWKGADLQVRTAKKKKQSDVKTRFQVQPVRHLCRSLRLRTLTKFGGDQIWAEFELADSQSSSSREWNLRNVCFCENVGTQVLFEQYDNWTNCSKVKHTHTHTRTANIILMCSKYHNSCFSSPSWKK